MHIVYTALIECRPEHLWSWLDDPEKQKRWLHGLEGSTLTNRNVPRVGTTFRMTFQTSRRPIRVDGEYTNYLPHRHLGVRYGSPTLRGVELQVDYKLQDLGRRTRLEYRAAADTSRAPAMIQILAPLFKLVGALHLKRTLKTLQACAEAEEEALITA